jgi:hypothetical protein
MEKRPEFRLILMSATVDPVIFKNHLLRKIGLHLLINNNFVYLNLFKMKLSLVL